jgi:hypothetical protein
MQIFPEALLDELPLKRLHAVKSARSRKLERARGDTIQSVLLRRHRGPLLFGSATTPKRVNAKAAIHISPQAVFIPDIPKPRLAVASCML